MGGERVTLVAFLEQDNLGIGYIASVLLQNHIDVRIVDFRASKERILEDILQTKPSVVGFSIIFQYHLSAFRNLIAYLRSHGVSCHFTAGGHYPSLRYAELLEMIPDLDSVVLFEGEYTLLELARSGGGKAKWKGVEGIAYRNGGRIVANSLRPLEGDLDRFPPPVRQPLREYALGRKYATLLAGRGCYHNCAFCSIRQFYSKPPGSIKRVRRPEMVVAEMQLLHDDLGCSVFMFQDDDFPLAGSTGEQWTTRFCELLVQRRLHESIMWKINCRPDEVQVDLIRRMKEAGLFLIYMGIEDGTDEGLALMNKRMKPETSLRAVDTIKNLGIEYDFGFMLFHPESTFHSIRQNLDFLEDLCGDGSSPVTFCKMLPYAETEIERRLRRERRIKGQVGFEDYDLACPALEQFYRLLTAYFEEWIGRHDGLLNLDRWARYSLAVCRKYGPGGRDSAALARILRQCTSQSNDFFIATARRLLDLLGDGGKGDTIAILPTIERAVRQNHLCYKRQLLDVLVGVENLADECTPIQLPGRKHSYVPASLAEETP